MIEGEAQYGQIAVSMCDSTSRVEPQDWHEISRYFSLDWVASTDMLLVASFLR